MEWQYYDTHDEYKWNRLTSTNSSSTVSISWDAELKTSTSAIKSVRSSSSMSFKDQTPSYSSTIVSFNVKHMRKCLWNGKSALDMFKWNRLTSTNPPLTASFAVPSINSDAVAKATLVNPPGRWPFSADAMASAFKSMFFRLQVFRLRVENPFYVSASCWESRISEWNGDGIPDAKTWQVEAIKNRGLHGMPTFSK